MDKDFSKDIPQEQISQSLPASASPSGLTRLIAAAVVDQKFCELLLINPAEAIETDYGDEPFCLTPEEREVILSIQSPASLTDLARQISVKHCRNAKD